jgi:type I restriction enzyme S subunit
MELTGTRVVVNKTDSDVAKRVRPNDFIIHLRSFQGGIEHSRVPGKVTNAYTVLKPASGVDPRYYRHFLKSDPFISGLSAMTDQLRDGQSVNFGKFSTMRLPIPPLPTQRAIADYLDRETAEIDAMAAELDELVETLNERRSAAVRRAVLSDTNPGNTNTPTLGALSDVIRRGISPTYSDRGVAVVSQKCVRTNGVFDIGRARQHREDSRTVPDELLLRNGDALINSTGDGTLGRTAIVRCAMRKMTLDSHVTLVRTRPHLVHPDYLGYFLATQEEYLIQRSQGSTKQTELAQRTVYDLRVPLPSLDEQRHIADYLDTVTAEIDSMIADARELKALLTERRSALITEVVTGRKEVPVP